MGEGEREAEGEVALPHPLHKKVVSVRLPHRLIVRIFFLLYDSRREEREKREDGEGGALRFP